ncbi:UNVERIFIED_CONTAM: hypothetical protein BEN50_22245 [Euhalothece sp. KZN 001]
MPTEHQRVTLRDQAPGLRVGQRCRTPGCTCSENSDLAFLGVEPDARIVTAHNGERFHRITHACGAVTWCRESAMPQGGIRRFAVATEGRSQIMTELANLKALEPVYEPCHVCGAQPVVAATGLCGPCTWGDSEAANGGWWDAEDSARLAELRAGQNNLGRKEE